MPGSNLRAAQTRRKAPVDAGLATLAGVCGICLSEVVCALHRAVRHTPRGRVSCLRCRCLVEACMVHVEALLTRARAFTPQGDAGAYPWEARPGSPPPAPASYGTLRPQKESPLHTAQGVSAVHLASPTQPKSGVVDAGHKCPREGRQTWAVIVRLNVRDVVLVHDHLRRWPVRCSDTKSGSDSQL